MSTILKGANLKGRKDNNKKKCNSHYKPKQDGRQGLKGPGISAAGPFRKDTPSTMLPVHGMGSLSAKLSKRVPSRGKC